MCVHIQRTKPNKMKVQKDMLGSTEIKIRKYSFTLENRMPTSMRDESYALSPF